MFRLAKYLKGYWTESIVGAVFKLTEALFELIVPLVMARIIDVGIVNGDTAYILKMGGIMIALGLGGLALALTCQYLASKSSQGFGTTLRRELYYRVNGLSHAEIDRFGTASIVTRLNSDVNQSQHAVAMTIRLASRSPFLIIGATIMTMILDIKLSIVFLITAPLIALILWQIMAKSVPYYKYHQKKIDGLNSITRENLSGARVIRSFDKQSQEIAKFGNSTTKLRNNDIKVGIIASLLNPMTTVVVNIAIIVIIWVGGVRVYEGGMSQGQIVAFVNYMSQILLSLIVFMQLVSIYTKASASASRINEILDAETSVKNPVGGEAVLMEENFSVPIVEFENVAFGYGGELVLSNINIAINRGETLGIIGGTGAGKSTLVNLIPRFYNVIEGEIRVNGVNVQKYRLEDLRGIIAIVPQKAKLFRGTIADNIKWGKREATTEEVVEAAKFGQAHDFIEAMPNKYESAISSNARNLSGGQIQRITIARAMVRKPQILIMDDSSSALDYVTDLKVRQAISQLKNTTTIIIAQRVGTVKNADRIIVLEEGRIIGEGTHQELFNNNDAYKAICLSQMNSEEADDGQQQ